MAKRRIPLPPKKRWPKRSKEEELKRFKEWCLGQVPPENKPWARSYIEDWLKRQEWFYVRV